MGEKEDKDPEKKTEQEPTKNKELESFNIKKDDKFDNFQTKIEEVSQDSKQDTSSQNDISIEAAVDKKDVKDKFSDSMKDTDDESTFSPGVLELTVHRASQLVNTDKIGKSDPYVKVRYSDQEFRSKTIANTLEPEWNFSCKLDIMNLEEKYIDINIYDDDFGRDNIEGCYSLPVKEAINELITEGKWYNLVGCKSGKVYISTSYTTIKMENKSTEKPVESTSNDNSKDEVEPFKENKLIAEKKDEKLKREDDKKEEESKLIEKDVSSMKENKSQEFSADEKINESSLEKKNIEDIKEDSKDLNVDQNKKESESTQMSEDEKETKDEPIIQET